ncbi:thiamine pyrophosphate-dependent enzyme [Niabella defluvii]|nr:thiamine pyrophosphate-dependent enzyme [Niabella sp. I65]
MLFDRKNLSNAQLIQMYRSLVYPRLIEEKMLVLLRQGKISKWFSGIGQEAISVGATMALQQDEWIMPLHRNLGVFTKGKCPCTSYSTNGRATKTAIAKGGKEVFTLEAKRIIYAA